MPKDEFRIVSGKVEEFHGERQIVHPDLVVSEARVRQAAAGRACLPDDGGPLAAYRRESGARGHSTASRNCRNGRMRRGWRGRNRRRLRKPCASCTRPQRPKDLEAKTPPLLRLAYDELLSSQLALQLIRAREHANRGRALKSDARLRKKILAALPYALTGAQTRCVEEIVRDLGSPTRMGAPPSGRRRRRQNHRRFARHGGGGRGRRASGAHGADGNPRAPARRTPLASGAGGGLAPCRPDGPRQGRRTRRRAGRACSRATSTFSSGRMLSSRRKSRSRIWASSSSTNSTASVCTNAWRSPPKAVSRRIF